jgi:tight adherence protein B
MSLASLVAFISAVALVIGTRMFLEREVNYSRFGVVRYKREKDRQLAKMNLETKEKSPLTAPIFVILVVTGSALFFGGIYIFTGTLKLALFASAGGLLAPKLWLDWYKKKQEKLVSVQTEQALETMATVIKSGGGMYEALDKAANNIGEPLKGKLEHTLSEMKIGVSEDEAFLRLADQLDIPEMSMLNVASLIRKEGITVNMATVFTSIQSNIRQRQAFIEEVKAITSENRVAVWIVAVIPFFTVAVIRFFGPDFIDPLFTTTVGLIMFTISTVMIIVGVIWALKIADSTSF